MTEPTRIHKDKQPRRPHHVEDWAETRSLSQADIAREIGADKSVVSRWFKGSSPGKEWQMKLAALFQISEEALFRHPNDDWMARFLAGRDAEEVDHIKRSLEVTFPRRKSA